MAVLIVTVFYFFKIDLSPTFTCSDKIGCVKIGPDDPVIIAVMQPMSGEAVSLGVTQTQSMALAVDKREGRFLGHPIMLHIVDSQCSAKDSATAVEEIVADPGVIGILGTPCSDAGTTTGNVVSQASLVMISAANTAPLTTPADGDKDVHGRSGFFRTGHTTGLMGQILASAAYYQLGAARVATINNEDAYTRGFTDFFKEAFVELGGEIVLDITIDKENTDMKSSLTAVAESDAELLFFPVFPPQGRLLVLQRGEVEGLENVILLSDANLLTDGFARNVGEAGLGVYFMGPSIPETVAGLDLRTQYKHTYGNPPEHATYAQAYDAATMLFHAMESVAVKERDGTLHIGRKALRDALYGISDFEGVSGILNCDEFGDCGAVNFSISRFDYPDAGMEGILQNVIFRYSSGTWSSVH